MAMGDCVPCAVVVRRPLPSLALVYEGDFEGVCCYEDFEQEGARGGGGKGAGGAKGRLLGVEGRF